MSDEMPVVAAKMKEAERLMNRVLGELLPKNKLETLTFDQETLDSCYSILDELVSLNQDVHVMFYIIKVQARIDLAEETLDQFMHDRPALLLRGDKIVHSLEGFHERGR